MTPDTALATLTADMAAVIQARLPGLRTCKGVTGRLDLEKLKSGPFAAPAVLISRIGMRQSQTYAGQVHSYDLDLAAFVLTKEVMGLGRDESAAVITQVLLRLIPNQFWGLGPLLGEPRDIAENPLVTELTEKAGVALTAITWTQPIGLDDWPVSQVLPIEVYTRAGPDDDYAQVEVAP